MRWRNETTAPKTARKRTQRQTDRGSEGATKPPRHTIPEGKKGRRFGRYGPRPGFLRWSRFRSLSPPWAGPARRFRCGPFGPRPRLAWCLGGAIRCGPYVPVPGFFCAVVSLVLLGVAFPWGLVMSPTPNLFFRAQLIPLGEFPATRDNGLRGRNETTAPSQPRKGAKRTTTKRTAATQGQPGRDQREERPIL